MLEFRENVPGARVPEANLILAACRRSHSTLQ